jgi:hypothetical protein
MPIRLSSTLVFRVFCKQYKYQRASFKVYFDSVPSQIFITISQQRIRYITKVTTHTVMAMFRIVWSVDT